MDRKHFNALQGPYWLRRKHKNNFRTLRITIQKSKKALLKEMDNNHTFQMKATRKSTVLDVFQASTSRERVSMAPELVNFA